MFDSWIIKLVSIRILVKLEINKILFLLQITEGLEITGLVYMSIQLYVLKWMSTSKASIESKDQIYLFRCSLRSCYYIDTQLYELIATTATRTGLDI